MIDFFWIIFAIIVLICILILSGIFNTYDKIYITHTYVEDMGSDMSQFEKQYHGFIGRHLPRPAIEHPNLNRFKFL
jgi:hypothetical protein